MIFSVVILLVDYFADVISDKYINPRRFYHITEFFDSGIVINMDKLNMRKHIYYNFLMVAIFIQYQLNSMYFELSLPFN